MIKRSLIVFFALLSLHVVVVSLAFTKKMPEDYEGQNLDRGREFLANSEQFQCFVVGSSLAYKIHVDFLPESTFNLSFIGRGAFDGLRLIEHSRAQPELLLIELNTVYRGEDTDFTAKLTNPYSRFLYRPSHEKPVNYLMEFTAKLKQQLISHHRSRILPYAEIASNSKALHNRDVTRVRNPASVAQELPHGESLKKPYDEILQANIREWQSLPKFYPLEDNLDHLEDIVSRFAKQGVQIVFFEMPVHHEIEESPRSAIIRSAFQKRPKLQEFPLIRVFDLDVYQFHDGLHLVSESLAIYSQFLGEQIRRIPSQPIGSNQQGR